MSFVPSGTYAQLKNDTYSGPGLTGPCSSSLQGDTGAEFIQQRHLQCLAMTALTQSFFTTPFYTPTTANTIMEKVIDMLTAIAIGHP